ncbi:MAG: tRNA dihydrouridine(20/20a) synthase DusA [Acidobacteriota bacterium]
MMDSAPEDSTARRGRKWPLSVAPMMDRTDRHYRFFMRQITRHTLLYTEMVTAEAILKGDRERLLGFDPEEHPIALQLGGDDSRKLAQCARIAEDLGYDEVNLNVGCPSDRVQKGRFGACLMAEPETVAESVAAIRQAVAIPVTVKHRIGIDDLDRYEDMRRFVEIVAAAGCDRFSVHARKAWLKGLSPKENREIPPLRYEDVYRLKRELPELRIEINGGIVSMDQTEEHLQHVDGVMIGRAAYDRPFLFAEADRRFFGAGEAPATRRRVLDAVLPYVERWHRRGHPVHRITRHMINLFADQPGARYWRRFLSENAPKSSSGPDIVLQAASRAPATVLDQQPYLPNSTSMSSPTTRTL